ncbi:hypothetical protein J2Z35_001086 [Acetoanaerobium pronyense]|uniref:HRDC domain-containing protein n=1 Tax=Acetoanaerobium pronyense TaxID=1482736 RepID=A0ABS4KHQ0_9FIRM|nr:HRDC domain-containing protein [Acetoanaerobium pronyense]MBP2027292.1 hypothetical protein [Acetoanaerobium pronyense]
MINLFNKMDKVEFLRESNETSEYIEKLKELQNRATGDVKSKIEKEIKICTWGMIGEKNIAFELKNSGIPMYVIHDLSIEIEGLSAQIDYIVITRKINFIIECKNLIGDIEIDNNGNFVRKYTFNGRTLKEGIYSPITQNQRHLEVLKKIKKESGKSNILARIFIDKYFDTFHKSIVVLSNPKTILNAKYAKKEIKDKVIRADQLTAYIKKKINESKELPSNDKEFLEIGEKLLNLHRADKSLYAKKYKEFEKMVEESGIKENQINETINSTKDIYSSAFQSPLNKENISVDSNNIFKNDKTEELIKKLKEFRLKNSRTENIKPYFIFNDKQMLELIEKFPKNKEELVRISGFGDKKAEKYGDKIIEILASIEK